MKISLQGSTGSIELSDRAFGVEFNEPLVHQVITAHRAAKRKGSKAQKNRSAVRGGGAKPWRQKGTGRARAGSIRSPIWVGGGRAFAAKKRDYSQKVNRKMYRAAMRSVLSELVRQDRLVVVKDLEMTAPKTSEIIKTLGKLELDHVLILVKEYDDNLTLSVRNVPWADVLDMREVNPVSLVRYEKVLATADAIKALEERFA